MAKSTPHIRYQGNLYVKQDAARATKLVVAQDPKADKKKQKREQQILEEHLAAMFKGISAHAAEALGRAKIKTTGTPKFSPSGSLDAPDGYELKFDVTAGSFAGLEASVYFDYGILGLSGEEPVSLWESVKFAVQQTGEKLQAVLGKGEHKLRQMVLFLCGTNYGGKEDTIPSMNMLLEAAGFLQTKTRATDTGMSRKAIKKSEEDKAIEDTLRFLKFNWKDKIMSIADEHLTAIKITPPLKDHDYLDLDIVKKLVDFIHTNKFLDDKKHKYVKDYLVAIPDAKTFQTYMNGLKEREHAERKPMYGPAPLRATVQRRLINIVNKPPYNINYNAWEQMTIGSGPHGEVVVQLAAPAVPMFVFMKAPGGAAELLSAYIKLETCNKFFTVAKDEKAAGKLAWCGTVLGKAAELGTNPKGKDHHVEEDALSAMWESKQDELTKPPPGGPTPPVPPTPPAP